MQSINQQIGQNISQLTREFELITHNLANVDTAGYKRRTNGFTAALEAQKDRASGETSGLIDLHESLDFTQGPFKQTARPLDLALNGSGFFVIEDTSQPLYTRAGSFQTNTNGQLTDSQGRLVSGTNGPITIPRGTDLSQLNVLPDGTVATVGENGRSLGRIRVVDFSADNQQQLIAMGESTYAAPEGIIAQDASETQVVQGAQEGSNVNSVEELVGMINVTRMYEAHIKFITARSEAGRSLMNVAMG